MRVFILSAMVVAALSAPAFAWNEPDSFRGVPWGASSEQAKEILSKAAEGKPWQAPECLYNFCTVKAPIGPVGVELTFWFREDRFVWAYITFTPSQYAALRAIFIDRYGPPTSREEETLQNRMGTKFTNEILKWIGPNVEIRLSTYANRFDKGSASLTTKEERERRNADMEKMLKKGKEDL